MLFLTVLIVITFFPNSSQSHQNIPYCPEKSIRVYEHTSFTGRRKLIELEGFQEGEVYSLKAMDMQDNISSVVWNLPSGWVVMLHDHENGTGKTYQMKGNGSDPSTHNKDFRDCATSFSYRRGYKARWDR